MHVSTPAAALNAFNAHFRRALIQPGSAALPSFGNMGTIHKASRQLIAERGWLPSVFSQTGLRKTTRKALVFKTLAMVEDHLLES